jgi:outer membrane protein assembly factor BamB
LHIARSNAWWHLILLCLCLAILTQGAGAAEPPDLRDPYKDLYKGYKPPFLLQLIRGDRYGGEFGGWRRPEKVMKLSSEPSFFTLNMIHEDARANALVKTALGREAQGKFRDALTMYQIVIDKFPHALYRVSDYGVFVPISQYCQRRILSFPPGDLAHYRTLHDARARERFEQARRKNSLIGLSEIVDTMLATSYGGRALIELGDASLDNGHYLASLEFYRTIRDFFPADELRTPELDLKMAVNAKMLGIAPPPPAKRHVKGTLSPAQLAQLRRAVETAKPDKPPFHSQLASPPHSAADDYTLMPPTDDPLSLKKPVWRRELPGSRSDFMVYTQPVVTRDSVIFRHQNIVYCRSILNGELRWKNDLGGRARWQTWVGRKFPMETVLVQDGLVFTCISKGGASLVALDEVTGQLRWAYGPMVAATAEQARMRFEGGVAGGPRTVFAGYVLDNIEGDAHTDTEYGVIAFDSTSGRVQWRKPLCTLAPGKFSAGFAHRVRNRIRSYTSPPLCHQGTVYYNTNAGAIAAMDARSGRIKWITRYPYYPGIHDATRAFGGFARYTERRMNSAILWYNQRPLVIGDHLYILPVDTKMMLCLDRRTGRTIWSKPKGSHRGGSHNSLYGGSAAYLLGPLATGELVMVYSSRGPAVNLLDPKTGKTIWRSPDPVAPIGHASMRHYFYFGSGVGIGAGANRWFYQLAARPFLASDGTLSFSSFHYWAYPVYGWTANLCRMSLPERKIVDRRRYLSGELLARARHDIGWSAKLLKDLEKLPHKSGKTLAQMKAYQEMSTDPGPVNKHSLFLPHSRVTFKRYGGLFELRFSARELQMVYNRPQVQAGLARRSGPDADFAKAELAFDDAAYRKAATLLKRCLATISSEDLDFRSIINQQLFRVYQRLARTGIRAESPADELANCLGMSRTAGTLAEEIETLFALAEAYQRSGKPAAAAQCLRSIATVYRYHEYPIPRASVLGEKSALATARDVMDKTKAFADQGIYRREMLGPIELLKRGLPLYVSTLSPLPKDFTMRAGDLAALRLIHLQDTSPKFAKAFEAQAAQALKGRSPAEQLFRLPEFPRTQIAQSALDALFGDAARKGGSEGRRLMWQLADVARICALQVPKEHAAQVEAPRRTHVPAPLLVPAEERRHTFTDTEGGFRLALERRGDRSVKPSYAFVGTRVRKRLDNKFRLTCMDLDTGKVVWEKQRIRLKGLGQEPGFFEAFCYRDTVVVHGLYDVLAFALKDGELLWRYRVPFDFEIRHAVMSGDLLVLSGTGETLALYIPATAKAGEVAWQVQEQGDLYVPPYLVGDRVVLVRQMPFNVTTRYRATGRLIARLKLPDLSRHEAHPLVSNGPRAVPFARDGERLIVTDGWYYIMVDAVKMRVLWKRLIDSNDTTREPAIRFTLKGSYLAALKEDYDIKTIHMLNSRTGQLLWRTDPKSATSPKPMHSSFIVNAPGPAKLIGLEVHPGQGYYFVSRDCKTGRELFKTAVAHFDGKPQVRLIPKLFGKYAVVQAQDRQTFELNVFDTTNGKRVHTVRKKGVGPFGVHGRVSATVQNGRLVFLTKHKLSL